MTSENKEEQAMIGTDRQIKPDMFPPQTPEWEKLFDENVGYDEAENGCEWGKSELKGNIKIWLSQAKEEGRREGASEERQFILNILDGIDMADEQMGNKGGGTKAIRHALNSRSL